jgi:hypothetical protein
MLKTPIYVRNYIFEYTNAINLKQIEKIKTKIIETNYVFNKQDDALNKANLLCVYFFFWMNKKKCSFKLRATFLNTALYICWNHCQSQFNYNDQKQDLKKRSC